MLSTEKVSIIDLSLLIRLDFETGTTRWNKVPTPTHRGCLMDSTGLRQILLDSTSRAPPPPPPPYWGAFQRGLAGYFGRLSKPLWALLMIWKSTWNAVVSHLKLNYSFDERFVIYSATIKIN